ncbi:hypothetical protein Trydic_g1135 [Trypoxylus dichotomus]
MEAHIHPSEIGVIGQWESRRQNSVAEGLGVNQSVIRFWLQKNVRQGQSHRSTNMDFIKKRLISIATGAQTFNLFTLLPDDVLILRECDKHNNHNRPQFVGERPQYCSAICIIDPAEDEEDYSENISCVSEEEAMLYYKTKAVECWEHSKTKEPVIYIDEKRVLTTAVLKHLEQS